MHPFRERMTKMSDNTERAAATADREFNPHDRSQHGVVACGNRHKAHETSEFYCTQCHLDATYSSVPNGWNVVIDGITYKVNDGQLVEQ